jgi:hypothetical protein
VTAISKDLADDAKEEAAKDVAAAAAKKLAEGEETASKSNIDPKAVPTEPSTSSAPVAPDATSKDPKVASSEPSKETPKDAGGAPETKAESEKSTTTKDRTIAIDVAQEHSKEATNGDANSSEPRTEQAPVSLKITLGADGEVKAVTKCGVSKEVEVPAPTPVIETSKVVSVEKTTKTALISTAAPKLDTTQEASSPASPVPAIAEPKIAEIQDASEAVKDSKVVEETPKAIEETPKAVERTAAPHGLSVSQLLGISGAKSGKTHEEATATSNTTNAAENPEVAKSAPSTSENVLPAPETSLMVADSTTSSAETPKTVKLIPKTSEALDVVQASPAPLELAPAVISAVSNVSTVTSTTKTISQPVVQDGMVTISQESLDLLHSSKLFPSMFPNPPNNTQKSTICIPQSNKSPPSSPTTFPHL